ncbi:MAG TPA: hypothetical protein VFW49_12800 [Fluviicoccus sp.]|nr:hypothetical protein [Fluviicoccus sp.]
MSKSVFCTAATRDIANNIVEQLKIAGFQASDISALFPDQPGSPGIGSPGLTHEQHSKLPEGASAGAGVGGLVGGGLGWLMGIGALAIPGLGPFIAAGPIMAALGGAAAGAALGGLSGALIGLGVPEYEAKRYEGQVKAGNILISVHTRSDDDINRAKDVLGRNGAQDISCSAEKKDDEKQSAA